MGHDDMVDTMTIQYHHPKLLFEDIMFAIRDHISPFLHWKEIVRLECTSRHMLEVMGVTPVWKHVYRASMRTEEQELMSDRHYYKIMMNSDNNSELDRIEWLYRANSVYDTDDEGSIERDIQEGCSLLIESNTLEYSTAACRHVINDNVINDGSDGAVESTALAENTNRNTTIATTTSTTTSSTTGEGRRSSRLKQQQQQNNSTTTSSTTGERRRSSGLKQQQQQNSRRVAGLPPFPPHKLAFLLELADVFRNNAQLLRDTDAELRQFQEYRAESTEPVEFQLPIHLCLQLEKVLGFRPCTTIGLEGYLDETQERTVTRLARFSTAIRAAIKRGVK